MDGSFQERFARALEGTYDRHELKELSSYRLGHRLELISEDPSLSAVIFALVQWAAQRPRWAELPVHAVEYKVKKGSNVPALVELRGEFEAAQAAAPPAALPPALLALVESYDLIPAQIAAGAARDAWVVETVGKIRAALPPSRADLPDLADLFHLSESDGKRVAAILALERWPDARFLRWLAERVACEPPVVGLAAATALGNAAYVLERVALTSADACAAAGLRLLPGAAETDPRAARLRGVGPVVARRTGPTNQAPAVPFDQLMAVFVGAVEKVVLKSLLMAHFGLKIDLLTDEKYRRERVVYDVLHVADQAGWAVKLVEVALANQPESVKLQELNRVYAGTV